MSVQYPVRFDDGFKASNRKELEALGRRFGLSYGYLTQAEDAEIAEFVEVKIRKARVKEVKNG